MGRPKFTIDDIETPDVYGGDGEFDGDKVAKVAKAAMSWPPEQRKAMLEWLEAASARERIRRRYANAAELAASVDPMFKVTPMITRIAEEIEKALTRPNYNLIITGPPQEGKAVAGSTSVPSRLGNMLHEDIKPGDTVFHPSGKPITVLAVHPIIDNIDRRVHFSDHSHLDVHSAHEWTVWDRSNRKYRTVETGYLETQKLYSGTPGKRGHRYRFQLPFREALQCPEADLPIAPYTLGLWLGNGQKHVGLISRDARNEYPYDYPLLSTRVHSVTGVVYDQIEGLTSLLRLSHQLAGIGQPENKHIPRAYLRASIAQRRDLLAGLIDTDGHIPIKGQQICFDNTNEQLVRDTAELIRTLGYRAHVHRPTPAKTAGPVNGRLIEGRKDMWRVTYCPHDGEIPTKLEHRKTRITGKAQRERVAITRIEKIDPVPGRCITVDSEDGLYLVGQHLTPTHNSTVSVVWGAIRAWQLDPNRKIILSAYADSLAERHSAEIRGIIESHGAGVVDSMTGEPLEDRIGLSLAPKNRRVSSWGINGSKGGLVAVGLGSGITGRHADAFFIDDPYKNIAEADSTSHRRKIDEWMAFVVVTRLAPGANIILNQTRWHPEDLSGKVLAAEELLDPEHRTWHHINFPAIAEEGVPDTLGRKPGEALVSTRGRVKADFERIRRQVGERVWYSMYEGIPRNPAGGLFERAWFEPYAFPPAHPVAAVVGIDPADTGEGDETGIIGAVLAPDGTVVFTHDRSGLYTSDQWARQAVELAVEMGAREISMEGFASFTTYAAVVKRAWSELSKSSREALAAGKELTLVQSRSLAPQMPFTITKYAESGDPVARASALRQAFEIRRAKVVEHALMGFEVAAQDWQQGQHCPDRVVAAVIAHWRLNRMGTGTTDFATPLHRGAAGAPDWMTRRVGGDARIFPFGPR